MNPPKGQGELVLYLDLDGVAHPENVYFRSGRGPHLRGRGARLVDRPGHTLMEHAPLLVELLAPYPQVRIVLSTSWVRFYGYGTVVKKLPRPLRPRCVGATFHSLMDEELFKQAPRGMQIWSDVLRRKPRDWLALDDDHLHWPAWCRDKLVRTDEYDGLAKPEVLEEFKTKLAAMCAGAAA